MKKIRIFLINSLLIMSFVFVIFGCGTETTQPTEREKAEPAVKQETIKMKLCTSSNMDDPNNTDAVLLSWFAKRIAEVTDNRVEIEVYGAETLFKNYELMSAVGTGGTDLALVAAHFFSSAEPIWSIRECGMIFENVEHDIALMESEAGNELKMLMEKNHGFKILTMYNLRDPGAIFNNKAPITKLEDMKGLKIRVPESKGFIDTFSTLGVSPISLTGGEVPTALQQGMIDGVFTMFQSGIIWFGLQDSAPYALDEAITSAAWWTFDINVDTWNNLPTEIQQAFQDVIKEMWATYNINKMEEDQLNIYKDQWNNFPGTTLTKLSPEEKIRWQNIFKPEWEQTAEKYGELGSLIYKKIEELRPQFKK